MLNRARQEWETYLKNWVIRDNRFMNGVDVGCGTARIDDMICSIDNNPHYTYAHAQFVHNCHDLELFNDGALDFVFSSHVLEDFKDIPVVFLNWWKKIKKGGLILLLLPDMEVCKCDICTKRGHTRYARIEDGGNPSHRTNVGKKYITEMLEDLKEKENIHYEICQVDTIPHDISCSVDFVIKKL